MSSVGKIKILLHHHCKHMHDWFALVFSFVESNQSVPLVNHYNLGVFFQKSKTSTRYREVRTNPLKVHKPLSHTKLYEVKTTWGRPCILT